MCRSYGRMNYLCCLFASAIHERRIGSDFNDFDVTGLNSGKIFDLVLSQNGALNRIRSIYMRASLGKMWVEAAQKHRKGTSSKRLVSANVAMQLLFSTEQTTKAMAAKVLHQIDKNAMSRFRKRMERYTIYEDIRLKFAPHLEGEGIVSVLGLATMPCK